MHGEPWTGRKLFFPPAQYTALAPVLLNFCFHYFNTHVKQYAGTLFDCTTGVVRIQMAPNTKTNMECVCTRAHVIKVTMMVIQSIPDGNKV